MRKKYKSIRDLGDHNLNWLRRKWQSERIDGWVDEMSQRMIIVRIFKEKAKRKGHCDQIMMCHTEATAVSEYDKALGENGSLKWKRNWNAMVMVGSCT